MNYKIIDNFLDKENFLKTKHLLEHAEFNWFYREYMVNKKDPHYFSHAFFNKSEKQCPNFNVIQPLLNKLNYVSLVQVRANLTLKTNKPAESSWHMDYNYSNGKTAIFYLNTCNGFTILDKDKQIKINSIENRIVVFDNNTHHKSFLQTDTNRRIILNINYFDEN
jgi:hypothetical protein